MHFNDALKLLHLLRQEGGDARADFANGSRPEGTIRRARAASICVASGKGGTGKSVVVASLARCLSKRGRTLVVDADMGVGNAHILQDVAPRRTFVDVVHGRVPVRGAVTACNGTLDLVGAGSGVSHMAGLSGHDLRRIGTGLEELERDYEFLVVDSAAGISDQTVLFAAASDLVVLVTTPDPTAMTDAYAFLKVLLPQRPRLTPLVLVNRARDGEEAHRVMERIAAVSEKFLHRTPRFLGHVPEDRAVVESVGLRRPVVLHDGTAPASIALERVSDVLAEELRELPHPGLGETLLGRVELAQRDLA